MSLQVINFASPYSYIIAGEHQLLVSIDRYFVVGSEIDRTYYGARYRQSELLRRVGGTASMIYIPYRGIAQFDMMLAQPITLLSRNLGN